MNKISELIKKYKELISYLIFGVLTTLVNWAVYALVVRISPSEVNSYLWIGISKAIAWVAGVVFAFITNKLWVFESKSFVFKTVIKEFTSFVAARALTGVLEVFGVPLLVKLGLNQTVFGIEGMFANLIVSVAVVILNYIFSKLVVFRQKKTD